MEKYQIIINILIYSVLPTLICLYINEKLKGSVKNSFDKKIEHLKKEHSIEISKFQTELNFLKERENFKFTKLHEKRFQVLEETYIYLNEALQNLSFYVSPIKTIGSGISFEENEDQLNEKFRTAHNKFSNYFSNNRIYFDDELETLISNYFTETIEIYNDYSINHNIKKLGGSYKNELHTKAYEAYKKIPEKVNPIKKQIEIKFKKLLEE